MPFAVTNVRFRGVKPTLPTQRHNNSLAVLTRAPNQSNLEKRFKWPELTVLMERSLPMTNHDPRTMRQELERVRVWATEQRAEGTERPWSVYE